MNRRKQIRMKKFQNWGFGDDSNNKVLNKNETAPYLALQKGR